MAVVFMRRKTALICILVLGIIALPDGISKRDIKEIVLLSAAVIYAIVSLILDGRKKLADKNGK